MAKRNRNHGSLRGLKGGGGSKQYTTPLQFAKQVLDDNLIRNSPNYELYLNAFNDEIRRRLYDLEENRYGRDEDCDETPGDD